MHLLIIAAATPESAPLCALTNSTRRRGDIAVADDFPNFSICGLPYYLSGRRLIGAISPIALSFQASTSCGSTQPNLLTPRANPSDQERGREKIVRYDRLIVATGATPIRPNFPGARSTGLLASYDGGQFCGSPALTERQAERAGSLARAISGWRWRMPSGSEGLTSPC